MSLLQPKQIDKLISAIIKITNMSVSAGSNSTVVTTQVANALNVAANNGGSVPLQVSSSVYVQGIVVSAPINRSEIFDSTSKQKIEGPSGEEVYGRMEYVGSSYVLKTFYLNNAGVEVAFTAPSNMTIDFDFVYRFTFSTLPTDALVAAQVRNVTQDTKGQNATQMLERITVTSVNTLSTLSSIPTPANKTILTVNGKEEYMMGPAPAFSVSGTTISWNAINAGYSLETSDVVFAKYFL